MSLPGRFCSLILGLGVKFSVIILTPSPIYLATNPPKRATVSATHF